MIQALPFLAAAGSAVQGIGGLAAGNRNYKVAHAQALEEERTGAAEIQLNREQARAAIGTQLASQYADGMLGGTGSALDALRESQINAAIDAATIRRERTLKAQSLREQGKQARTEGRFALVSGLLGAGSNAYSASKDWAQARSGQSRGNVSVGSGG